MPGGGEDLGALEGLESAEAAAEAEEPNAEEVTVVCPEGLGPCTEPPLPPRALLALSSILPRRSPRAVLCS